jgi:phage tail-like protein
MIASSETRIEKVVLPNLDGMEMSDARLALNRMGVARVRVQYVESYEPDFRVLSQQPQAGEIIEVQHEVELTVARQSLVDYLPQIYQQPEDDRTSFLKNFLYIVQTLQDRVSMRLDSVHELFDPRSTEPEFLPWLASWLAITLSPEWDDLERRKMLRAATELFPHRGTARAIEQFVQIYTGADVEVIENEWPYAGFRIGVGSTVGTDTVILPPMNLAHCFVVRIARPPEEVGDEEIIKIHQIISAQKPAHTSYFLSFGDTLGAGDMDVFMEVGEIGGIGVIGVPEVSPDEPKSVEVRPTSPAPKTPRATKKRTTPKKPVAKKASAKKPAEPSADAKTAKASKGAKKSSRAKKPATSPKTNKSETQD